MISKRTYFSILAFVILFLNVQAQSPLNLNEPDDVNVPQGGLLDNKDPEAVNLLSNPPNGGYDFTGGPSHRMDARIDPTMIAPQEYGSMNSGSDLDNYTINTSLPVGYTPGAHSVSPSGAATYTIPIQLPPGTNGMVPNLSIAYNSQGGNGLLGMGWNLAGLSMISRTNKTHYFNGEAECIQYNYSDPFALDGQRLLGVSGSYGHDGSTYGTESEGFSQIISHGSSGDGPEWFEVKTKDGRTIIYGNEPDAISYGTGDGEILYWMITKVYDQHGNYIQYQYIKENNQIRLDKILYTGNESASLEPYNVVQFSYQERQDELERFLGNHISKSSYLLKKIRVTSHGVQFRTYKFDYGSNFYSFLKSVSEFGASVQDELNKTIFEYEDKGTTELAVNEISRNGLPTNTSSDANMVYYPGDFNGDGVTDFLGLRFEESPFFADVLDLYNYVSWSIYINNNANGSGFTEHELDFSLAPALINAEYGRMFLPSKYFPIAGVDFMIGDLSGDGKDDIVVGFAFYDVKEFNAYYVDDSGPELTLVHSGSPVTLEDDFEGAGPVTGNSTHVATLGDFDGDGILEFFGMNMRYGNFVVTSFNSRVNCVHLEANSLEVIYPRVMPTDFNGDGITDLIISHRFSNQINTSEVKRYIELEVSGETIVHYGGGIFSGASSYNIIGQEMPTPKTSSIKQQLDFNGDGLADLIIEDDTDTEIWLSKGSLGHNNIPNTSNPIQFSETYTYNKYEVDEYDIGYPGLEHFYKDLNGDGLTDLLKIWGSGGISISLNKGMVGGNIEFEHYNKNTGLSTDGNTIYDFGDLNGDGNLDLIIKNNTWCCINFVDLNCKASTKDRRLKRVKNGFGKETKFEYKNMSSTPISSSLGYPVRKVYGALNVASRISTTNSLGGLNDTKYDFFHPLVHMKGKGFIGFEEQQVEDLHTNIIVKSEFDLNTDYFINLPELTTKYLGSISEENKISSSSQNVAIEDLGNNRFFSKLMSTEAEDLLTGLEQSVAYFYDANYNITLETKTIGEGATTEITNTSYSQFDGIDGWHVSPLPGEIEVETIRNSETELSETTQFIYNPDGTVDTKKTRYGPSSHAQTVQSFNYGDNPFGLVESITVSGLKPTNSEVVNNDLTFSGTEPIADITTDQYVYSEDGRDILEHTDRFGFTSVYTYYNGRGKTKTVTDHLGRQNYFEYDGFGRIKKEIDYLGQVMSTEREFVTGDPIYSGCETDSDVLYTKAITSSDGRTVIKKYNQLGQLRFKESTSQFNTLYSSVCYDGLGREKEKTTPHFNGDANIKTAVLDYDVYGRLEKQTLDPLITDYTFDLLESGHVVSVSNDAIGTRSSKTDFTGRVVETTDPGGTLVRSYQSGGLLKKVELGLDVIVENTYDEFGRQIMLDDMNAGTTFYNYDSFDNLIFQQDANGNILENTYDEFGRIESRIVKEIDVEGEEFYDYEYYTDGPEETLLQKETAPSGHATEYTYDEDQNIATITEIIDGEPYTTSFDYDEFGKPVRKEYPSGFSIRYVYDDKDYLERITSDDGQIVIWEVTNGNAQGQITNYTLGNGLTIEKNYDDDFYPESTTVYNGSNTVFSFEYDFDAVTGNLKSRNLHGTEEHFFYDTDGKELNRLAGTGPDEFTVSETYTFADNGNIISKADMGPYQYRDDKKNAVEQINYPPMGSSPVEMQNVLYNHFNSASEIQNLDDQLRVNLEYGPDDQRRMVKYWDESGSEAELIKTRLYAGSFEKQINADLTEIEVNYISAGGQLVAMYVVEDGVGSYYYPHHDHLGSIIHITDETGAIVYTQSFDPWGRTRNPDDLTYDNIPERPDWLWRGYTGHEHLDEFGLINMNGRLYDPVVGRMLSPDNYVQNPDFTQSYNRYSYVWNNPLKYTDPSGEIVWAPVIAMAIWSGVFNVATNYAAGNVDNFGQGLAYFGIGAAASVVGGVGGQAAVAATNIATGALIGGASAYGSSLISGLGNSALNGGQFNHTSALISAGIGTAFGALGAAATKSANAIEDLNGIELFDNESIGLPELQITTNGYSYQHSADSKFRVAQAIQRSQSGNIRGFNKLMDFSKSQIAWIMSDCNCMNAALMPKMLVTFGGAITVAGGMGANLSGGFVFDFNDGSGYLYGSAGASYGVDVSGGIQVGHVTSKMPSGYGFSAYDMGGWGTNQSVGIGYYDFSHGTNSLYNSGSVGVSFGLPGAYTYNNNYTVIGRIW